MKVLVALAEKFEEIEATTVINVLRRAGVNTDIVSLSSSIVTGNSNMQIISDKKLSEIDANSYGMLVLPGSKNLLNSRHVIDLIKNFDKQGKFIAAINISTIALAQAGILEDKVATVFPGYENKIPKPRAAKVVVAKNVITARGPASAMDFALKLAEIAAGKSILNKLKRGLAVDGYA